MNWGQRLEFMFGLVKSMSIGKRCRRVGDARRLMMCKVLSFGF